MACKTVHGLRTEVGHKKEKMQAMFKSHTHTAGGCKTAHGGEKRGGAHKQIRIAPGSRVPI